MNIKKLHEVAWSSFPTKCRKTAKVWWYFKELNLELAYESAGFRSQFWESRVWITLKSCDTTKQSVWGWQYMLLYSRGVELSGEGSNGCHSRKARLFEWIELSVAVKRIYVSKTNVLICSGLVVPKSCLIPKWSFVRSFVHRTAVFLLVACYIYIYIYSRLSSLTLVWQSVHKKNKFKPVKPCFEKLSPCDVFMSNSCKN